LQIDRKLGLLSGVDFHFSPNHDVRPNVDDISGIVIHNISLPPGEFGGGWIDDLFLNKLDPNAHPYFEEISALKVSAHLLIRRSGEVIQYVPFHQRAWHAGVSSWDGRDCCNDFTIGIEMEGCDDDIYTDEQYASLQQVTQALMLAYPQITSDRITGHEFISPGRKTDPGRAFKWQRLFSDLSFLT